MTRALAISIHSAVAERAVHGVYQRMDMIMRALCATMDKVEFLCLNAPYVEESSAERAAWESALRHRWGQNVSLLDPATGRTTSPRLFWPQFVRGLVDYRAVDPVAKIDLPEAGAALLAALDHAPDVIFAHRLGAMAPLLRMTPGRTLPPVVFDMDDIEHVAQIRRSLGQLSPARERMRLAHTPALIHLERRALGLAAATLVCSEHDRHALLRWRSSAQVRVVSNAVDIAESWGPPGDPPTVMFVGSFDYRPNVIAAQELVTKIWPDILMSVPTARLRIVGNRPDRVPVSAAPPAGVEFTGFVTDLASEYRRAHVVCCPIRSGGGTRVKIIEAAAYAKPVVSTTLGAEGLSFLAGTEICIVDQPRDIARACVELLRDPQRAQRMGQASRDRVGKEYDRRVVSHQLQDVFRSVIPS